MPEILDPLATPRPEGGAVRLTFGLTSDAATVYVQRVPAGDPAPTHGDPAVHVVFDGEPVQVDDDYRFHRATKEPQPRYAVWDIEAFTEHFADAPNTIEGSTWAYYLYAVDGGGTPGAATLITAAVQRRLDTRLTVNAKELVYQRARYHAEALGGLFVAKLEHLHNEPPPQVLVKARHQHLDTHLSEMVVRAGTQVSTTFRAIVEVLLITRSPDERDDLGDALAPRLLSDLHLFGELGWDGLKLAWQDGMVTFNEQPHYTRSFTLDGLVDAHLIRTDATGLIDDIDPEWRVSLD